MIKERCAICGAILSENNTTGIGYECAAALHSAKAYKAKCDGLALKTYIYKAAGVRELYLRTFDGVVFRNDFNKSFYNSMKSAERISQKQLTICEDKIIQRGCGEELGKVWKAAEEYANSIIDATEVTREEVEKARNFIRNK